jgi:hypothetical protein
MWATMKKFVVHVEMVEGLEDRQFVVLADNEIAAVCNYWIHCMIRVDEADDESSKLVLIMFRTHYVVSQGCFDDGKVVSSAPCMWLSCLSDLDRKAIADWVKKVTTANAYETWRQKVMSLAPKGATILIE